MSDKNANWAPPVDFFFQVQFHLGAQPETVSFMEVNGLESEITLQESNLSGSDGVKVKLPQAVVHGNITLKRALEPTSEQFTSWVNKCFRFMENGFISPCDMIISLMDSQNQALASWTCTRAYPVKWNLGTLDAQKSGLAIETLVITYNILERKK